MSERTPERRAGETAKRRAGGYLTHPRPLPLHFARAAEWRGRGANLTGRPGTRGEAPPRPLARAPFRPFDPPSPITAEIPRALDTKVPDTPGSTAAILDGSGTVRLSPG